MRLRQIVRRVALVAACTVLRGAASAQPAPAPAPAQPAALRVTPPKLLSDPDVPYPAGAAGDATVVLVVTIGADGRVREASAREPHEPFSGQAARAALEWRFEPARRDGTPIASKILLEVVFREPKPEPLPEEPPPGTAPEEPPPGTAPGAPPTRPRAVERPSGRVAEPGATPPGGPPPMEIDVVGERVEPSRSATLTRAEVRQIPGTFGDPFRAIETLPGVTPIVSGLPFFFVRGAPPGNVGYFLDGIRVPLLFHVGVGPSVIHPALIERVDLYPGGYPARFGRFAGGIVAGETVQPRDDLHGEYNVRVFDAGAMAEAPFANGKGAVLLGGRYSYTAALLTLFSPDTVLDYWDYQGRVSYDVTPVDRLSMFSFGSYDFVGQKAANETLTVFGTEFHRVDLRYDRRLGSRGRLRTAFSGGIDRSRAQQDRYVRDRLVGARTELTYRVAPRALLRAGTDLQLDTYDIELGPSDLSESATRIAQLFPARTDLALGLRGDVVLGIGRLEVTPGVRVDLYGSEGQTAVGIDPRLATRAKMTERVALLAAMGIAHQPPAFVVPLPGFQPGGLRGGLQTALQESAGVEVDLGDATIATATVFQNAFFDMSDPLGVTAPEISGCPPGTFPTTSIGGDQGGDPMNNYPCGIPRFPPGTLGPDRSGGGGQAADSRGGNRAATAFEVRTMGRAYGFELYLKRQLTSRLGGFFSYTLSRSTRMFGRRSYVATFDRTHVMNGAIAYNLGRKWRAGTRVVFYTGLPKVPDPTDPDSTRLPPFYRVDLRLEKRWQLGKTTWISGVAEWMNATLSKESVSTTCTLEGCESQEIGPITIPSLGVEGGF